MSKNKFYNLVIIGGGLSSCVFASSYVKKGFKGKIAIVEAGRKLGGRSSTRYSFTNKGWELNHGSPNFNITNKSNNLLLNNFINELLDAKFIHPDPSELIELNCSKHLNLESNYDFHKGNNYIPRSNMTKLSEDIISLNNSENQVDFYFEELIIKLEFKKNKWSLYSDKGDTYHAAFVVISSNLLLHKRSLNILGTDEIPLRKAIPPMLSNNVDLILNLINKQVFIQRLTFLIYTRSNYFYKDDYVEKFRYFILNDYLEKKYNFERIIFQRQKNNNLGIVVHTKDIELIREYLELKNEYQFKKKLLSNFNQLFDGNPYVNQLVDYKDISIMRWRASQPSGTMIPECLQVCEDYKIGFCGDWFDIEGFGRIEGAISSALRLSSKFSSFH